jgi:mxaK protein
MSLMPSRRATRWVLGLLAVVLGAAAFDAAQVLRDERLNRAIASGQAPAQSDPIELRFAHAHAQAASGAAEAALNQYRGLQGDSALGQAARYNSANLLNARPSPCAKATSPDRPCR